jgi:hypothetical protein
VTAKVLKKLREKYSDTEINKLTCLALTELDRDKTPVYVVTIVYLLTNWLDRNQEIAKALLESISKHKDILWCDLLFGLLMHHLDGEDVAKFGVRLLRSEDYKLREIGDGLLYCSGGFAKRTLVQNILEAYQVAYKHELNENTKSPYKGAKERYQDNEVINTLKKQSLHELK